MTLLTDALRAQIGRTATYTAPEPLGAAAIRNFAIALGDAGEQYASGRVAPPTLVCETNQYAGLAPDDDGYAGHSWRLEVPGSSELRGGNAYEFHAAPGPQTVITATWTLTDMAQRTTRDGREMLVVTSQARYSDQDGALLAVNTETLIYLGDPA